MALKKSTSLSPPISSIIPKRRVNWHEATVCAIQIELRDYAGLLDFQPEFVLGKNSYRIDLLIIKKLSSQPIPKNIARIFQTYNLFEIKGIHSSVTINSYYKSIGYAGLLISQLNGAYAARYTALDLSITFLTFRYPRKLICHLKDERNIVVEKSSQGIYYIHKEIFKVQIIVICELPPDENLYLRCLTDSLQDSVLISRLADDYAQHKDLDIYTKYLNQLATANLNTKGASSMVCEGLLNLFGTTSEEIIAQAKKESDDYYLPKISELTSSNRELSSFNKKLSSSNKALSSQIDYLKNLLKQNHISFDLGSESVKSDLPNQ